MCWVILNCLNGGWGWQPPAVSDRRRGEAWTRTVEQQSVSSVSLVCTRGSSWRTCEESQTRRKLRQADDALKTWECRHPYTWDSRVSPSPCKADRSDRWEEWPVSHRRHEDRSQSLLPDISQSSGQYLWWWGCICNVTVAQIVFNIWTLYVI